MSGIKYIIETRKEKGKICSRLKILHFISNKIKIAVFRKIYIENNNFIIMKSYKLNYINFGRTFLL